MRILLVLLACSLASPVFAQGQLFDFALRKLQQQIDKEQQRRNQREQSRQNQQNWQLFNEMWQDCFQSRVKQRCIDALQYPNVTDADANKLRGQYRVLEQYEDGQRRAEEYREQEAARLRDEQARAERDRQIEQERRLEQAKREREAEERQRIESARRLEQERLDEQRRQASEYASAVDECRRFQYARCNAALASPKLTASDEADLRSWRAIADSYGNDRHACRGGDAAACDRALSSPAIDDHEQLKDWRAAASFYYRALGYYDAARDVAFAKADASWSITKEVTAASWNAVRELPTSTHIAGGVALLSMTVAGIALHRRAPVDAALAKPSRRRLRWRLARLLRRAYVRHLARRRALNTPPKNEPVLTVEQAPPPPIPVATGPVDTPAAHRAIRLAVAYLDELNAGDQNYGDEQEAKTIRTTLSLVAKQLDIAHRADPNAVLEADDVRMTQSEIRCETLVLEAKTWFPHNQSKAIDIIRRAKAHDPNSVKAWFWSGWFNYEQRNRDAAVTDLERVLSLDPDNIEAMKLLDRAQNLGAAEIAVFKVANARDNTIIGVQKTVSILRIPFLIISFPFRAIYWLGRAMYVSWTDPWRAARGDF